MKEKVKSIKESEKKVAGGGEKCRVEAACGVSGEDRVSGVGEGMDIDDIIRKYNDQWGKRNEPKTTQVSA